MIVPDGLTIENPALLHLFLADDVYVVRERAAPVGEVASAGPAIIKPILVIHTTDLSDESLALVHKILGAVKIQTSDIDLLPSKNYEKATTHGRRFIFLFGPAEIRDFSFAEPYTICPVVGGGQLIYADSLEQLAQSAPKKKQLWELMKKAFGL